MINSESNLDTLFSLEDVRGKVVDEQPFRLLILGDWTGDTQGAPLAARQALEIDRDNFDHRLRELSPTVLIGESENQFLLGFTCLDDFHPDRIFERLPLFAELRRLRLRLESDETFADAAAEMRSSAESTGSEQRPSASTASPLGQPTGAESAADLLEQILARSSPEAAAESRAGSDLGDFVNEIIRPHLVSVSEDERGRLIEAIDEAAGKLMRMILGDARFRALEASWRGLFFAVRRSETSERLKLYIADIAADDLAANLKSSDDLTQTFVYKLIFEGAGDIGWTAVAGNFAFDIDVDNVAALIRLAKVCEAADAPFLSHISPKLFGARSLEENFAAKARAMSDGAGTHKLWSTLRAMPESAYLAMLMPRFLGRVPFGAEAEPLENFSFEEIGGESENHHYLWINPAFAAVVVLTQSFAKSGWDGLRSPIREIEKLPTVTNGDQATRSSPAEVQLNDRDADALIEFGLIPLVGRKHSDSVRLGRLISIANPQTELQGKWTQRV